MNETRDTVIAQLGAARSESEIRAIAERLSPQLMQEVLAELRSQKDGIVSRLRVLVQVHDDAVELERLRTTNPRLAARIGLPGIPSQAAVGAPNAS